MGTLQDRLKIVRGNATQAEFAKSLSIPVNTLGRYERGVNNPDLDFLIALHSKFGVSLDWLIFGDEPKYRAETSGGPVGQPGFAVTEHRAVEGVLTRVGEKTLTDLYEKLVQAQERELALLRENTALKQPFEEERAAKKGNAPPAHASGAADAADATPENARKAG